MAHKFLREIIYLFASDPPAAYPATPTARSAEGIGARPAMRHRPASSPSPAGLQAKTEETAAPKCPNL